MRFTPCQAKALHVLQGNDNVFLTGAAGTGKSFLLSQFLRNTDDREFPILASTGAAAVLVNGRTFHSFFGLGICEGGQAATVQRALKNGRVMRRLHKAQCIVIDEVSMLSGEVLATAEEIARHARDSQSPWGGLRVIAVGDFAQLPPVQPSGTPIDWAFLHPVWQQSRFVPAFLTTTVRTNEPELLNVLNAVREGQINTHVQSFLQSRLYDSQDTFEGTRLFPHRRSAEGYNVQRLQALPGTTYSFETMYEGRQTYIDQLKKQCPITDVLLLKPGALVMFRKNDTGQYPYRYVNGTLGHVQSIEEDVIHVELLRGGRITVTREEFALMDGNGSIRASAYNFPLTLAWATTIHKAQGASIDRLLVTLSGLWESGQAYVALSRARSAEGLFISSWDRQSIHSDPVIAQFYAAVQEHWNHIADQLPHEPPVLEQGDRRAERQKQKKDKTPNHHKTHALLQEQKSLLEIAEILAFKEETIIGHIERLLKEGTEVDIEYLRPEADMYSELSQAFLESDEPALKPIFDQFEGRYSYKELKLVRLFTM